MIKKQFEKIYELLKSDDRKSDLDIHLVKNRNFYAYCYFQVGQEDIRFVHYEYYFDSLADFENNKGIIAIHFEPHVTMTEAHKKLDNLRFYLINYVNSTPVLKEKYLINEWQNKPDHMIQLKRIINSRNYKEALDEIISDFDEIVLNYESGNKTLETGVEASEVTVRKVLQQSLQIADYQRPYSWTENNVLQLLEDIKQNFESNKSRYRIGSIILYKNLEKNEAYEIVDGQQRITTLLLILKVLNLTDEIVLGKKLKYNNVISFKNISNNYKYIKNWGDSNFISGFGEYILDCCEMVNVIVYDKSEAFQMFDSQNGRGKELEPYNLLKAFHIREADCDEETMTFCDTRWEQTALYKRNFSDKYTIDLLGILFNDNLYFIRNWTNKNEPCDFTKKDIAEFKGMTLSSKSRCEYPWQNKYLAMMHNFENHKVAINKRYKTEDPNNSLFSINQLIFNGKPFFDYINTYSEIYKKVFFDTPDDDTAYLSNFRDFYKKTVDATSNRTGDYNLLRQYKSLILLLADRYGLEIIDKFYKSFYKWVFAIRLETERIKDIAVKRQPLESKINPFEIIEKSKSINELYVINKEYDKDKYAKLQLKNKEKIEVLFH